MTDYQGLDTSLNTSKKNLICNHCMYDCKTYENMKDHYKSEFHKYNLNRVTMNLNPLNFEEYTKKKEMYQKLHENKMKNINTSQAVPVDKNGNAISSWMCDVCKKSFASISKYQEHNKSKSHKKMEEIAKTAIKVDNSAQKKPEEEKTTKDDVTICLFCNQKSNDIESNMLHMLNKHKFDVPFVFCIKNLKGMLRLLAKKIVTYVACITCDNQNFKNYKSLQNHMIDKQHTRINNEDLEEFLFKFYDKKSLLSIKDRNLKKLKEYTILRIKLSLERRGKSEKSKLKAESTQGKTNADEGLSDGWETISEGEIEEEDDKEKSEGGKKKVTKLLEKEADEEEESEDEDNSPIQLPNGELLLENGTVLGNKIYQIYYKQRLHVNPLQHLIDSNRLQRMKKLKMNKFVKRGHPGQREKPKFYSLTGSNKGDFERINTLFKARKQVNV